MEDQIDINSTEIAILSACSRHWRWSENINEYKSGEPNEKILL